MAANPDHRCDAAAVAAAIGEPARERMLNALLDGRARTATELSVIGEVNASTTSAHLRRLTAARLIDVVAQGKHRYYRLAGADAAALLEALQVVAGAPKRGFKASTPAPLLEASTCYDHMAGRMAVALHDRWMSLGWWKAGEEKGSYLLTAEGERAFALLGMDVGEVRSRRRRFACACLDWSERKPHLAGALGAAVLEALLRRGWIEREIDSRALKVTRSGRRELQRRFAVGL